MSEELPTEGQSYSCGYCKKPITTGCYCSDACANGDERLGPLPLLLPPERLRYLKAVAKEYMAAGKPNGLVELVAHIEALDMRPSPEPSGKAERSVEIMQTEGVVTITTNAAGECVAVTRCDTEGRILKIIWERKSPGEPSEKPTGFSALESNLMVQSTTRLQHIRELEEDVKGLLGAIRALLSITDHGSNNDKVFNARVVAYAALKGRGAMLSLTKRDGE